MPPGKVSPSSKSGLQCLRKGRQLPLPSESRAPAVPCPIVLVFLKSASLRQTRLLIVGSSCAPVISVESHCASHLAAPDCTDVHALEKGKEIDEPSLTANRAGPPHEDSRHP